MRGLPTNSYTRLQSFRQRISCSPQWRTELGGPGSCGQGLTLVCRCAKIRHYDICSFRKGEVASHVSDSPAQEPHSLPPLICDPVCSCIANRKRIKDSWQPIGHEEREVVAHEVAIHHERRMRLTGAKNQLPGSQYPGDARAAAACGWRGRRIAGCYQGSRRSRGAARQSRSGLHAWQ